jgi:hypothetical protein
MSKQDKKIKKQKKGKAKAEAIIAETKAKVAAKPDKAIVTLRPTKFDSERKDGITDEQFMLGVRVRELRDQGEPWWAIARDLEMEGAGSSATTGKKGAARARTAYKVAFGDFPRTFRRGGGKGPIERNANVAALKKMKRAEAKAIAKAGKAVITSEMSDEEVAGMLKGRRIKWFSTETVADGLDLEACVHPKAPLYIMGEGDARVIEFREEHRRAPKEDRWVPGQIRTVRLRQIYSVR